MSHSESIKDIRDLINDTRKDFEQSSLCHSQTGRWLAKLNTWFQYITGIAALFVLGKDTVEWTKLGEKSGGEYFSLVLSTVCSIIIEVIVIINRVQEPAKKSELHFQKSDSLDKMKKMINHRKIKCYTYDDYNHLYLELEEKSSKLPVVRIPDWAKKLVNNQLREGRDSIQDMRENRREVKLKRSGIKLSKNDKKIYKGMERLSVDTLREIATSSTVSKLDSNILKKVIPVTLMNHEDLLDYLKCNLGVKTNNLTERHRNEILNKVNSKILENKLIQEISRVHGVNNFRFNMSRSRNLSNEQRQQNIEYSDKFSRSEAASEILSELMDEDEYRMDNVNRGDGPEGLDHTWQEPPPYIVESPKEKEIIVESPKEKEIIVESPKEIKFSDINPDISINIERLNDNTKFKEESGQSILSL